MSPAGYIGSASCGETTRGTVDRHKNGIRVSLLISLALSLIQLRATQVGKELRGLPCQIYGVIRPWNPSLRYFCSFTMEISCHQKLLMSIWSGFTSNEASYEGWILSVSCWFPGTDRVKWIAFKCDFTDVSVISWAFSHYIYYNVQLICPLLLQSSLTRWKLAQNIVTKII